MGQLLTLARDLRRRKARERQALFVAEGTRAVAELAASGLAMRGVLVTDALAATERGRALAAELRAKGAAIESVSDRELASAAETESPQGVLAIAPVPAWSLDTLTVGDSATVLVLDAVQDPGNVGTIIRTAAGLGAAATLALPGTVDLWNAKVVRSTMGAHFHHPCISTTWSDLDAFRREHSVALWAADAAGEPIVAGSRPSRLALVVGNEGAGLSPETRRRADRLVSLPIASAVESLNVAVATGILLYELRL